jgi:hypothetical protein
MTSMPRMTVSAALLRFAPVPRHSIGRFAQSLPVCPHASLTVAAHARPCIMGDDPALVIDAIRRVSAAAAARQPHP